MKQNKKDTSWEKVADWYSEKHQKKESFYHEKVLFPRINELIKPDMDILDIGCGEGALSRNISNFRSLVGIDFSESLIRQAKFFKKKKNCEFFHFDATREINFLKKTFDIGIIVLALQNISDIKSVMRNLQKLIRPNGKVILVLNHPAFRIPKYSGWNQNELFMYRWVNRYYDHFKIPIDMTPGSIKEKKTTWSFHRPIETYISTLSEFGFLTKNLFEIISPKKSVGKNSKFENFSRSQIPLFLIIESIKI